MQALRAMLISYMARQKTDRDGAQFELSNPGGSGVKTSHWEDRSVQEDETGEMEEEKKQTIRRKVELPNFDGGDPNGWMARAEIIFKIHDVKPEQRVDMAFVSMGGPAVHWFQCLRLRWSNLSWKKFRTELMKRFCGRRSGNVYEQIESLKQGGWVEAYAQEYEIAAARLNIEDEIAEAHGDG